MAKKSKTQKAKASAARQARKAERERLENAEATKGAADVQAAAVVVNDNAKEKTAKAISKNNDKDGSVSKDSSSDSERSKKKASPSAQKPKKKRFQFLHDVRSELKRVTWPTRIDVLRWSGVVACALVFFGAFTAILDNFVVTPLLFLISGADPSSIDWFSSFTITDAGSSTDASSAVDADLSAGDTEAGE